jgi:hypothetical protein
LVYYSNWFSYRYREFIYYTYNFYNNLLLWIQEMGIAQTYPRMEVIATKTLPTITSTSTAAVCDSGTATLRATASAGTINWYRSSTGGIPLGSGTSFTTQVLLQRQLIMWMPYQMDKPNTNRCYSNGK